jgi:hypothetical protein
MLDGAEPVVAISDAIYNIEDLYQSIQNFQEKMRQRAEKTNGQSAMGIHLLTTLYRQRYTDNARSL